MSEDASVIFGGVLESATELSKEELLAIRLSGRIQIGSVYFSKSTEEWFIYTGDGFRKIRNEVNESSVQELQTG